MKKKNLKLAKEFTLNNENGLANCLTAYCLLGKNHTVVCLKH